jgi:tetratricopeptide (TPR) repeat protein
VAGDDWFRNTTWNAEIEATFQQRLRRARDKSQYLRIQATCLAESNPKAALDLLDQYFTLGVQVDTAQAYVDRAKALRALGNVRGALSSYEAALDRECQLPSYKTQAYLDYACLVVECSMVSLYGRALEILEVHRDRPRFPIERYRAFGARALILSHLGREREARAAAESATTAAQETQSGFRYHQKLGLVQGPNDDFAKRVAALAL